MAAGLVAAVKVSPLAGVMSVVDVVTGVLVDPRTVKLPPVLTASEWELLLAVREEMTKVAVTFEGMGDARVPMSKVPPAFTLISAPTIVQVLEVDRLYINVPVMTAALLMAVFVSSVTVVPPAMVTGAQLLGTTPQSHVETLDQFPLTTLVS